MKKFFKNKYSCIKWSYYCLFHFDLHEQSTGWVYREKQCDKECKLLFQNNVLNSRKKIILDLVQQFKQVITECRRSRKEQKFSRDLT